MRAQVSFSVLWLALSSSGCAEPQYASPDAEALQEGSDHDAGTREDAHAAPREADSSCIDRPSVLGAECSNVVLCITAGPCDLRSRICCLTPLSADCSARVDCGVEQRARCDGPEDCQGGAVCCVRDGATLCSEATECPENQRACHTDSDCEAQRCARGWPGTFGGLPVTYFADWGFCRS